MVRHLGSTSRLIHLLARNEKFRFLVVGGWNTLFGYLAFVGAYLVLRHTMSTQWILVVAYAISMLQSFATQKTLVFRAGGSLLPQLVRFAITNTTIFIANLFALPPAVEASGLNPMIVQGGFVAVSTLATYYLHKHFSFL